MIFLSFSDSAVDELSLLLEWADLLTSQCLTNESWLQIKLMITGDDQDEETENEEDGEEEIKKNGTRRAN